MTKSTQDTEVEAPRDFAAFLLDLNKGRSHRELSGALADLVAAVQSAGRPGTLTYKVTVTPQKGNDRVVFVADEVTVKPPKGERGSSIFYIGDDHGLHRNDPHQQALPL